MRPYQSPRRQYRSYTFVTLTSVAMTLKECTMREQTPIRVLIVDAHPVVRLGLEVALSAFPDIQVVGQAHNSEYALALCAKLHPDVVLMDLLKPQVNGVEATRSIRAQFPMSQVIIFTSFEEQELVQET